MRALFAPDDERPGSCSWVRDRLEALPDGDEWAETAACKELIEWLHGIAKHRAAVAGVAHADRAEVAQDAMPRIVRALKYSRAGFASAHNPAAMLERVTARAVAAARHRVCMSGLGGVAPNGRNWRAPFPRVLGGSTAARIIELLPASDESPGRDVERTAAALAAWVREHLGVEMTDDAVHATVYVLDRLVTGVGRAALVRGGPAGLAGDPAMRHLGFEPTTSRRFARWLLGRTDPGHRAPAVLDAFLAGQATPLNVLEEWRRTALGDGAQGWAEPPVDTSALARRSTRRIA